MLGRHSEIVCFFFFGTKLFLMYERATLYKTLSSETKCVFYFFVWESWSGFDISCGPTLLARRWEFNCLIWLNLFREALIL